MPLDEQAETILRGLNDNFPRVETMTGAQARAATKAGRTAVVDAEPVGAVQDREIPGGAGPIGVRIYSPVARPAEPLPVVVYFHGGGFVICDLDSHDGFCRAMCTGTGAVVVSVDYRLAPEARWPAAADDAYAATCWIAQHAHEFGGDSDRLLVAGDSSGGNLAAVAALMARDRGAPAVAGQLLIYPVIEPVFDTESYEEFAEDHFLTRAAMQWYWDQYLPDRRDDVPVYAAPVRAEDLGGLPPAIVITAERDPLRSEGEKYAAALADAGVPVHCRRVAGMFHGFLTIDAMTAAQTERRELWPRLRDLMAERAGTPST
ncbi:MULTISPECIES: alpha/beta hydrolase [unclassified Rhodococcus (in: high G+C Gram-positive bacteria)]|uniref:alpha/beta hydrolase n=1 Tax=unclassified Rhodococcus (in: high G+C Gram-positive bacteria) TaxID=192944 RepID=UPI001639ECC7|nr:MULTISPECIES: alpha/beta hydrolase [unclassified Rhodococcus (in: high G+C Gram-positive bacteria)]MBC2640051.1 alpha/beta hydrolase [Rhodococcus sp. 3A]MBC2895203.1 alpha/beta hydrolase [Rhodococcus sp. 4CII]